MKKSKGITLISLVITIVILIVLAGIGINMTVGENGILTKAKEAKKAQVIAEAKEKIGTEILAAQIEAVERDEELEQTQIADIISKYGKLQEDGDTIILNDIAEKVSLLDIYNGTTVTSGSYSENKAKIELLETQVAKLEQQLEDSSKLESEKSQELSKLKQAISDAKTLIASTITSKGVTTSTDATFETMANNIASIPSKNTLNTVDFSFSWSGSTSSGVTITKTATIPVDSEILCFARGNLYFKYKIPSGDGNNLKGGCCEFYVSFDNVTGVVTITMKFNPYTSYITVTEISSSGTLYYY